MSKLRTILLSLLILTISFPVSAQKLHTRSNRALKSYTEGKRAYSYVDYKSAEQLLLDAVEKDNGFLEAHLLLAELYKDQKRLEGSARHYLRVIEIDSLFFLPALYSMGEVQFSRGLYSSALRYFNSYLSLDPESEQLKEKTGIFLRDIAFALKAMENPVAFVPVSLGDSINTDFDEYWPAITVDDSRLFFTRQISQSTRDVERLRYQEDFYFSEMKSDSWSPAKSIGSPLNTPFNEGALSLSAGGQYMYFTACNRMDGLGGCDIYYSALSSSGWISGMNVGSPVNSAYWESQPSLSSDGQRLFFVSNRPGGVGGMDIWFSRKSPAGAWMEPVNLGKDVNTEGDEMSPFIHFDGLTLYFSSNGRPSMGGFDLFITRMVDDTTWTEVENLGYPINTQTDEMGLIINGSGKRAYYSSEVNPARGRDLYYFDLPENLRPTPVSYIKGTVYDKLSGRKLKAGFELSDLDKGKSVLKSVSNAQGEFLICLTPGQNYGLTVDKEKYLFYSESFFLKDAHSVSEPFNIRVGLSPVRVGEKMTLYNVFFETDSWELKSESLLELNKLYKLLENNNLIIVEVGGHTDSTGSDDHNRTLSLRRAESVRDYLISQGISENRINCKGYGDTMPVSDNDTNEGMRKNRRTEIRITGLISQE